MNIFFELLTRPLLNFLISIYNLVPDFGLAIILFTIAIRLVLFPLNQKALKSQREMADLQPKLLKVKNKFKDNKQKQAEEVMKVYKEHKINPFAGLFGILVQLPIFFALFEVLRSDFTNGILLSLYGFVSRPEIINQSLLGLIDLAKASAWVALAAGGSQFIQAKLTSSQSSPSDQKKFGGDFSSLLNKQMVYFFPILTFVISFSFPAGLALYWTTSNIFGIIQQWYLGRSKLKHQHEKSS